MYVKHPDEVIDLYDRGGGNGIGIKLANQTLLPDKLELTKQEKKLRIAFLPVLGDMSKSVEEPANF